MVDAFRLQRTDISNLAALTSDVKLDPNLPLEASCKRCVTGDASQVSFNLDWTVKVKVPLIGALLEKHAEGEIRRFSQLEIEIVEEELRKNLHACLISLICSAVLTFSMFLLTPPEYLKKPCPEPGRC